MHVDGQWALSVEVPSQFRIPNSCRNALVAWERPRHFEPPVELRADIDVMVLSTNLAMNQAPPRVIAQPRGLRASARRLPSTAGLVDRTLRRGPPLIHGTHGGLGLAPALGRLKRRALTGEMPN
eukprot:9111942-Alexandrium_andersonii.AAC.1